jgi:hypothetical protein
MVAPLNSLNRVSIKATSTQRTPAREARHDVNEEQIKHLLTLLPGARRAANGVIVGDERGSFYITDIRERDDDLLPAENMFSAFCTKKEIVRLREIKNSRDYLLRFRATAVADSPRLSRVMLVRRERFERAGRIWSLSGYYDTLNGPARQYLARLPRVAQKAARLVPFGFAPLAEANAVCLKSLVGEIVIVSETLRYFYYFMTICLSGADYGVESDDRVAAGLIALRIMIGSEAQDFEIDPRGILPPRAEGAIRQIVDSMIEFTFGHEYAHLLLNHLPSVETTAKQVGSQDHKSYSHAQEYAADLHAIKIIRDRVARADLAQAAYRVFLYLNLIELMSIDNSDVPRFSVSTTHPTPVDRLRALKHALSGQNDPARDELEVVITSMHAIKNSLIEEINNSSRNDLLTFYGSIYMRGLGGKQRKDRIDY